ncbi:PREDICTED: uncharacterized protein LOC106819760 [Priapulus caudatus]|uniref:Uncharacterized protein LOC106819760 n=1 Tax=Priapulus caudatus TaxID=37621 RepID=A0ABM1F5W5_PRICU|nr:PREDICTED: uncharacterized protein LOC106819760 [Priapulus caudatus]
MVIAATGGTPGLLGNRFLTSTQLQVRYRKGILQLSNQSVRCTNEEKEENMVQHSREIPQRVRREPRWSRWLIEKPTKVVESTCKDLGGSCAQARIGKIGTKEEDEVTPLRIGKAGEEALRIEKEDEVTPLRIGKAGEEALKMKKEQESAKWQPVYEIEVHDIEKGPEDSIPRKDPKELPEHLHLLMEGVDDGLTYPQRKRLAGLLNEFQDIFIGPNQGLGKTDIVRHSIETGNVAPIKQAPRRLPMHRQAQAKAELSEMLRTGIIEPSDSPWASPIVLVTKKDGNVRFCIDYRKLNKTIH